ncbi:uncharacterized protein HMPREF1541_04901 [Cyphellophora europaea CBS 101466]|uniref:Pre-rRNA-processing protein RIX1 n=1 Tax=Cyphellophora europaea (strain CBS 101466) TaxID=1220924 RepID=W2RY67_CYPE1|nr:uncharacterized protein HMPREF1541_04901 [Cyphellophora europaea CBS 101466]ETN40624.1 hypothetical protein HMPREF1541_04901 [Cyphellophora europaea CBS 101466]
MEQLSVLRSTAQRLTVTPVEDLPRIAGFLAASLSGCSRLGIEAESTKGVDFSGPLHKLRTRLSSLLQDRTAAGRSTAAVLIKSYVETVRPVESAHWESWARGLIACLNKADPWECKRLYINTITRIFLLCRGSVAFQRDVTSPLLPAFINAVLSSLKPTTIKQGDRAVSVASHLLHSALQCIRHLLQEFSSTFRPFVTRLKQISLGVLGEHAVSQPLRSEATSILCALHLCAPKATAVNDWDQTISNIVVASHESLDLLFRAVIEDWTSSSTTVHELSTKQQFSKPPELAKLDIAGLGPWKGLHQGFERLSTLLRWLRQAISSRSQISNVPLGALVDLLGRISGTSAPSETNRIKTSPEVSKDEREEVWAHLPKLHIEALELSEALIRGIGAAAVPLMATLGSQMLEVFESEAWNEAVRAQCYKTMSCLLRISGSTVASFPQSELVALLKVCCRDLLQTAGFSQNGGTSLLRTDRNGTSSIISNTLPKQSTATTITYPTTRLHHSAKELVVLVYEHLPPSVVVHTLRTELDRTVILCNNQAGILASAMHPPRYNSGSRVQPSLLPFLLRGTGATSPTVEALLRPRLSAMSEHIAGMQTGDIAPPIDDTAHGYLYSYGNTDTVMTDEDPASLLGSPEPSQEVTQNSKDQGQTGEREVTIKRAFSSTLQASTTMDTDPLLLDQPSLKKPRIDEGTELDKEDDQGQGLAPKEVSDLALDLPVVQAQVEAFPAGDSVVIHGSEVPIPPKIAGSDASDDDSDIPEIDPELATDDDDDEVEEEAE